MPKLSPAEPRATSQARRRAVDIPRQKEQLRQRHGSKSGRRGEDQQGIRRERKAEEGAGPGPRLLPESEVGTVSQLCCHRTGRLSGD